MRRILAALTLVALALPGPLAAQSRAETLADIRQQLSVVYVEVQRLKRELSTTGGAQGLGGAGNMMQRIDAIEVELQRLTAKAEELEHRITRVVTDGTNRIGDIEFQVCELDPACDIATFETGSTLGGQEAAGYPVTLPVPPAPEGGAQLAVAERADFDRAKALLDAGENAQAAEAFAAYVETYPGGPLSGQAHYWRGEALERQGRTADAARAYLESFSGAPNGPVAPDALFKLGMTLEMLGQRREACVTLAEVAVRFPDSAARDNADAARASIGCQ